MASESRQAAKKSSSEGDSKGFAKSTESEGDRLPFEPGRKKAATKAKSAETKATVKSSAKSPKPSKPTKGTAKTTPTTKPDQPAKSGKTPARSSNSKKISRANAFAGIPEVVSQRMARRMGFFCGIPTACGMLTFVLSYFIVTRNIFELPTVAVLLVSLGFFGLGVLGLSYGALSASWDEERVGTWFGWNDFRTNFRRTVESWRSARQ